MSFAGHATDHQDSHGQETWEFLAHKIDNRSNPARYTRGQILPDEEQGLNCANGSGAIFDQQIMMLKAIQSLFEDLVIAVIFASDFESLFPLVALLQGRPGDESRDAVRNRNSSADIRKGFQQGRLVEGGCEQGSLTKKAALSSPPSISSRSPF